MVPSDLRKTNFTVDDTLLVRGRLLVQDLLAASEIKVANLIVTNEATIPNINMDGGGGSSVPTNIVLTEGNQTVNGIKTFTSALTSSLTSNQVELGSTNKVTLNAVLPSASRVYSIQDPGADANFVMSEGAQTINGVTTFGTSILLPTTGGTASALNYYEEFSSTMDFMSNAFAGTRTSNYTITRTGNQVTVDMNVLALGAASGSAGVILSSTAFPERFMFTSGSRYAYMNGFSNSAQIAGLVKVLSTGTVRYAAGAADGSTFANTGNIGVNAYSMTWTVPGPA